MKYIILVRIGSDGIDCPYCVKAQELLNKKNLNYKLIAFNKDHDDLLQEIKDAFDWKTVPMIFSKEEHLVRFVGGYTDLISLFDNDEQ